MKNTIPASHQQSRLKANPYLLDWLWALYVNNLSKPPHTIEPGSPVKKRFLCFLWRRGAHNLLRSMDRFIEGIVQRATLRYNFTTVH